jgi:hypothetical protein
MNGMLLFGWSTAVIFVSIRHREGYMIEPSDAPHLLC